MASNIKTSLVFVGIAAFILFFSRCMDERKTDDPRGGAYAGSAACQGCHRSVAASYLHTAHYQSLMSSSMQNITGSFSKDSNTFVVNDSMKVVMENRKDTAFQVLYVHDKEKMAQRIDLVFGNVKGQSYCYWKDDLLFQLPVSYFNALQSWTSSPGYPAGRADFDRPIGRRCFECHSAFISQPAFQTSNQQHVNALDKNTLIPGIDCERCHGPAAAHVQFHSANPDETKAKYITVIGQLSRNQKIAVCAVCHSGNRNFMLGSTFVFKPGDTLARYMVPDIMTSPLPDVHGNQTQLLAMSKCYLKSEMDCSTCHNTHVNDRGNYAAYAQHCQTCHTQASHNFCKMAEASNTALLAANCTRCHMPAQPSKAIMVRTSQSNLTTACLVASHRIAVYPKETSQVMAEMVKLKE